MKPKEPQQNNGEKVKKQKKLKRSLSFQSPKAKQAARSSPRSGDKKPRAPRGSVGTFAGHRPPKDPTKLEIFEEMEKESYLCDADEILNKEEKEEILLQLDTL
mgnify:CR=1 FL=1